MSDPTTDETYKKLTRLAAEGLVALCQTAEYRRSYRRSFHYRISCVRYALINLLSHGANLFRNWLIPTIWPPSRNQRKTR